MAIYLKGANSLLWLGVLVISGIIIYFVFIKNGRLQQIIDQLFSGMTGTTTTPTTPPATTPPPSGGGGSISTETTCPSGGETCEEDDQGRYDCNNVTADAYEATWCGSFSGDDLTIKMYGPPHSNEGDCCWCVLHVTPGDGLFKSGGEGPHSGGNCEDYGDGESIGTTDNICVKATMEPGPTMVGYALIDGQWKEMSRYTGHCGCEENSMEKTGDQVTFRNDGNFQTTCATVKPLGAGGITPASPTTTPPPASGGEEDEEEEEDDNELDFTVTGSGNAGAQGTGRGTISPRRSNLARDFTYNAYQSRMRRKKMYSNMGSINRRKMRMGNLL